MYLWNAWVVNIIPLTTAFANGTIVCKRSPSEKPTAFVSGSSFPGGGAIHQQQQQQQQQRSKSVTSAAPGSMLPTPKAWEDFQCFQGRINICSFSRATGGGRAELRMRGGSTRDEGRRVWRNRRGGGDVYTRLTPMKHGVADEAPAVDTEASDSCTAANKDPEDQEKKSRRNNRGLLLLATVPLVWGTYAPSVKYMYDMGGDSVMSPPGLVFNFACYLVSALTLAGAAWFNHVRSRAAAGSAAKAISPQASAQANRYAAQAGLELGGWLFLGSTMQVWGLELTTASRAAFLVQLTTVMVPVLEAFVGKRKLKPQVWTACALATVGVALVSLGGILPPGTNIFEYIVGFFSAAKPAIPSRMLDGAVSAGNLRGDLLVALSALFYSLHVVRLGVHVSRVETLALARAKAVAELGYSAVSVAIAAFFGAQGDTFLRFAASLVSRPEVLLVFGLVVIWNGAMTTAYAMWAQTRGQAVVAPSEANLVYSMQPLWSTLFAVVFLKEVFGTTESAGAGLVLAALFLATRTNDHAPSAEKKAVEKVASDDDGFDFRR